MLHQLRLNSLNWLTNVSSSNLKVLGILFFSLVLSACGSDKEESQGSADEAKPEFINVVPDGTKPTIVYNQIVNKCNYDKSLGFGDNILFEVQGSESLMVPEVLVAGNNVDMSGQHNTWRGEFYFPNNIPEEVESELIKFIAEYSDTSSEAEDISGGAIYNEIAGDDAWRLTRAIEKKYQIEISKDEEDSDTFKFDDLYERVYEQQLAIFSSIEEVLEANLTVDTVETELKDFVANYSEVTPEAESISYDDSFSSISGDDAGLASALSAEYQIQVTEDEQSSANFAFHHILDRVLEQRISSYADIKLILLGEDSLLTLATMSDVNDTQKEALKKAFKVKTTEEIESTLVTAFDWVDKINSLEIPVIINYSDTSGEQGDTFQLSSKQSLRLCEDGVCQCFPDDISGKWKLHTKPGGMGVGRAEGDIGDWSTNDLTVQTRDCLFDDIYTFDALNPLQPQLGNFFQSMGEETWLEPWQSPNGVEECGVPQSPFDGSTPNMSYDWDIAAGTLTLIGRGAHIGLPRVTNLLENTGAIPVVQPTVYKIATASDDLIVLNILSAGPSPWWHFELERIQDEDDSSDDSAGNTGNTGNTGGTGGGDSDGSGNSDSGNANAGTGTSSIVGTLYQETPFDMSIAFGEPTPPTVAGDGDIFSVPADANDSTLPQANTGFAYNFYFDANGLPDESAINPLLENPLTFGSGGAIVFEASVPSGGSADVRFKLERLPYDAEGNGVADTEPSYTTSAVTVSRSDTGFYSFEIPSQYGSTFSNFILYIDTPNVDVKINNIKVYTTPESNGDVQGPFDMTFPFGDASIVPTDGDPYYVVDSSQGNGFAGFAYNFATAGYETNPLLDNPLTFGDGGTITFTASVPDGQEFNTADIRFRFEKEASEFADPNVTEPSCNSSAVTIQDSYSKEYEIEMPIQADRTFSNIVMYIDTDNTNILISDIRVVTTPPDDTAEAVSCGYDLYGKQGPLDMTSPYGNGSIVDNGEGNDPYYRNTDQGFNYAGYANSTVELYPFEFGEGGTLEFTAFVPEGQASTSIDINFQLQKQGSDTGKFCDIAPIWEAPTQTISGSEPETFTINIPPQGGNDFSNMIMEFSEDNIDVSITDVYVTTTEKTEDAPTVPEECSATPIPSVYPVDGVNTAAMFNGTFGDEEGGAATIQINDTYEFPSDSAAYGGWANGNNTLYPIEFTGGFFAQKKIYFCASTTEDATVYFRFENQPYPANVEIYNTAEVSLIADGNMHAYESNVSITYAVNSLLFLMLERDTPITMGKVMGTWNGQPTQDITTDADGNGVVDYCDDFPVETPDWVDTDNDGASDEVDSSPDDQNVQ